MGVCGVCDSRRCGEQELGRMNGKRRDCARMLCELVDHPVRGNQPNESKRRSTRMSAQSATGRRNTEDGHEGETVRGW